MLLLCCPKKDKYVTRLRTSNQTHYTHLTRQHCPVFRKKNAWQYDLACCPGKTAKFVMTGEERTLHNSLWHMPAIVARRVASGFTNLSVKLPCSDSGNCPMSPISNIVRFRGCHTGLSLVGAMPACTNKRGCCKNEQISKPQNSIWDVS